MTIASKLIDLVNVKDAIKSAIVNKGVEVPVDTPFSSYPDKIASIPTGGVSAPIPAVSMACLLEVGQDLTNASQLTAPSSTISVNAAVTAI